MLRLQFAFEGKAGRSSGSDSHASNGVAEISFDACHRSPFELRLLDELVFGRDGDVLDFLDLHAARSVGKALVFLSWLAVSHVHCNEVMLQLQFQLLVLLMQREFFFFETNAIDSRAIETHPKYLEFFVHMHNIL